MLPRVCCVHLLLLYYVTDMSFIHNIISQNNVYIRHNNGFMIHVSINHIGSIQRKCPIGP